MPKASTSKANAGHSPYSKTPSRQSSSSTNGPKISRIFKQRPTPKESPKSPKSVQSDASSPSHSSSAADSGAWSGSADQEFAKDWGRLMAEWMPWNIYKSRRDRADQEDQTLQGSDPHPIQSFYLNHIFALAKFDQGMDADMARIFGEERHMAA
ncbi:hypothetical protein RQP46_002108 [Phenoliferia psychrophenolica]